MMEEKDIRILLNKYYVGETDEVDENRLVDYFATSDVPQSLAEDKRMFFALYNLGEAKGAANIEAKMERQVEIGNMIESKTAKRTQRNSVRWLVGVAASLLVIVSVGVMSLVNKADSYTAQQQLFHDEQLQDEHRQYSEQEIQHARFITQMALAKFSKSMDKGLDVLNKNQYNIKKGVSDKPNYSRIDRLFNYKDDINNDFKYIGKYQKMLSGGCLIEIELPKNISCNKISDMINLAIDSDIGFLKIMVKR